MEPFFIAGVWGRYASVMAIRPDDDGSLLNDVYLLEHHADGTWPEPDTSSGSGLPDWVLRRPATPPPDWHGADLVMLGAQVASVGGRWVAELTVMATWAVRNVAVSFGGAAITVPVPENGLVTLPGVIRSFADVAEFRGLDDTGATRAVLHYRPVAESDLRDGWPA